MFPSTLLSFLLLFLFRMIKMIQGVSAPIVGTTSFENLYNLLGMVYFNPPFSSSDWWALNIFDRCCRCYTHRRGEKGTWSALHCTSRLWPFLIVVRNVDGPKKKTYEVTRKLRTGDRWRTLAENGRLVELKRNSSCFLEIFFPTFSSVVLINTRRARRPW